MPTAEPASRAFPEPCLRRLLDATAELGRFLVARQPTISFSYKADGTILSELDVEVQRRIRDCVRELDFEPARAAHFVGEEEDPGCDVSRQVLPGRWNWIVDAIDGTAAYTKGVNTFGISIALVDGDCRPVVGLVHLPAWRERFDIAWQGELYSWRDGELLPAEPSSLPDGWSDPDTAPVSTSYVFGNSDLHRRGLETFRGKVRNLGGTAAHLALLAERTNDPIAVVLSRCQSWDLAGGLALTEAAGMDIRSGRDWSLTSYQELVGAERIGELLPAVVGSPEALRVLEPDLHGRLH